MQFTLTTVSIFLGLTVAMPGQTYYSTFEPTTGTFTAITQYSTGTIPVSVPTTYPYHHTSMGGDCDECGGECGDGIVQYPEEQCDLGPALNGKPGSGCSSTCQKCGYCGDGIVEPSLGETCDLGPLNGVPGSGCSKDCKCVPVCGNGKVEEGEECDAGPMNGVYGSGCSKDCKFCGYCGDSIVDDEAREQCDLGYLLNGAPGSSCSANCTICA